MFCNSRPYIFDDDKWIGNWLSSQLLISVFQEYLQTSKNPCDELELGTCLSFKKEIILRFSICPKQLGPNFSKHQWYSLEKYSRESSYLRSTSDIKLDTRISECHRVKIKLWTVKFAGLCSARRECPQRNLPSSWALPRCLILCQISPNFIKLTPNCKLTVNTQIDDLVTNCWFYLDIFDTFK